MNKSKIIKRNKINTKFEVKHINNVLLNNKLNLIISKLNTMEISLNSLLDTTKPKNKSIELF